MRLLTRTWNLAHGRTEPETGTTWLEEMVRLVAAQDPNVVCLQEVPVWALSSLGDWSSMRSVGAIAVPSRGGSLGRWLTSLLPLVFRSALTGQANAIHVRQEHAETTPGATIELNGRDFQRTVAATAGLGSA